LGSPPSIAKCDHRQRIEHLVRDDDRRQGLSGNGRSMRSGRVGLERALLSLSQVRARLENPIADFAAERRERVE
jgi:DNA-binding FadR family transcriptional regulator